MLKRMMNHPSKTLSISRLVIAMSFIFPLHQLDAAPPQGVDLNSPVARWVQSWHNGQYFSCCGIQSDCRPTQLRTDANAGSGWDAWISKDIYGPSAPDAWVPADQTSIGGNAENNPTPTGWACWYNNEVRCISAPNGI